MRKRMAVLPAEVAVAVLAATVGGTAMAAGKFKTVTRTFSKDYINFLSINDSATPPAAAKAPGAIALKQIMAAEVFQ